MYKVEFTDSARKLLKAIDRITAKLIMSWVKKNLVGCTEPCLHGEPLVANERNIWRYRVGNYRILAEIQDAETTILILGVCRGCNNA